MPQQGTVEAGLIWHGMPPQAKDAERALIGSVMISEEAFNTVSEYITSADLYDVRHIEIWKGLKALQEQQGQWGDPVVLADFLQQRHKLGDAGGPAYLCECLDAVPHAAHAEYYARMVRDRRRRRQIIYASNDAIRGALDYGQDFIDVAGEAEQKLHDVLSDEAGQKAVTVDQAIVDLWQELDEGHKEGVPTGFCDLQNKLHGLQGGSLVIVAARPSMGKTAFAGALALHAAKSGKGVLFISLEQPRTELAERWLSSESLIGVNAIRHASSLDESDRERLLHEAAALSQLPILIDDQPYKTLSQISALARLEKRRRDCGLVVIDYLQLITPEDLRINREQQVASISRSLKILARQLDIPVICLAQLNRQSEQRANKIPTLADLRESGAIEQDADVVMLLHRPGYYDEDADKREAQVIIAKHRGGPVGTIKLDWFAECMAFRTWVSLPGGFT